MMTLDKVILSAAPFNSRSADLQPDIEKWAQQAASVFAERAHHGTFVPGARWNKIGEVKATVN
jgi:hypothetical protein